MFCKIADSQSFLLSIKKMSWKEKINFFDCLHSQIVLTSHNLHLDSMRQLFQGSWLELIKEKNINILLKILSTLNTYVSFHSFKNLRLQKELVKNLVKLSPMHKHDIDQIVQEIIINIFKKENQIKKRQPLKQFMISDIENTRKPTFLSGDMLHQNPEGQILQESTENICERSNLSYLLLTLIEIIKLHKPSCVLLCLKIVNKLRLFNLINNNQIQQLEQIFVKITEAIKQRQSKDQENNTSPKVKLNTQFEIKQIIDSINIEMLNLASKNHSK